MSRMTFLENIVTATRGRHWSSWSRSPTGSWGRRPAWSPGLPALLGAGLVAVDQLDVVAHELAGLTVQVVDGQNHAPLAVDAEAPGVAGDRQQGPDLDRLALRHRQTADWSPAVQS